jgi:hypothetical protein
VNSCIWEYLGIVRVSNRLNVGGGIAWGVQSKKKAWQRCKRLPGCTDGDSIGLLVRLYHKLITHRQTMLVGVFVLPHRQHRAIELGSG